MIMIIILISITDEYQIKIGMTPPNYVHGTNVFLVAATSEWLE